MTQAFDIAVVLGAAVGARGEALPSLRRRVSHAVTLHRRGLVPCLLLSGGGRGLISEADAMRRLAIDAGVRADELIMETRSCNTFENAAFSLRLLESGGRGLRLLIVSDAYHLPRALYIFRRLGADAAGSAPASPTAGVYYRGLIHEAAAMPLTLWRLARRSSSLRH